MARHLPDGILSGNELNLDDVWAWHEFQGGALIGEERVRTLDALLTGMAVNPTRYFGLTHDEIVNLFDGQRTELHHVTMLSLLAATEAALRIDYIVRVSRKMKDAVSKEFAVIYKSHKLEVSLEEQILSTWKNNAPNREARAAIGDFKGALKLRHWLAHGRYWKPRLGRQYDPQDVLDLCDRLLKAIAIR